jgi:acyl carrier protein
MSLNIKLNGSNYVSEMTKQAFEEALNDGHQVTSAMNDARGHHAPSDPVQVEASRSAPDFPAHAPAAVVCENSDYRHLVGSLERGFAQSYEHQQMILRAHQRYLDHQSEYAGIFSDLMQQQGAIFAQGSGNPRQAETAAAVLESLSRSMERFHELQESTLNVHKQFLEQQASYSQAYVRLLGQQQGAVTGTAVPAAYTEPDMVFAEEPVEDTHVTPAVGDVTPADHSTGALAPVPASASQPAGTLDAEALTGSLLAIVSEKTGYPADMLELEMDLEADLGIDSIKRVEILGALQDENPDLPAIETDVLAELRTLGQIINHARAKIESGTPAPVALPAVAPSSELLCTEAPTLGGLSPEVLTGVLLEIVSEKTGYPADMLELDMDMEADLGIDSIKRVEILGALQGTYPDLPALETDVLSELHTLGQVAVYIAGPETAKKKA